MRVPVPARWPGDRVTGLAPWAGKGERAPLAVQLAASQQGSTRLVPTRVGGVALREACKPVPMGQSEQPHSSTVAPEGVFAQRSA